MPEGDTIYRAARALQGALAGRVVTGFETGLAELARVNDDLRWWGGWWSGWSRGGSGADLFFGRFDFGDAYVDEWELASVSGGGAVADAAGRMRVVIRVGAAGEEHPTSVAKAMTWGTQSVGIGRVGGGGFQCADCGVSYGAVAGAECAGAEAGAGCFGGGVYGGGWGCAAGGLCERSIRRLRWGWCC